jgi:dTDP-4-dehydrorhamnose 3,5-epimerase
MPFVFTKLSIPDVVLIQPKVFVDERGYFAEVFKDTDFRNAGIEKTFVQINQSKSSKNVIRGLHFQRPPMAQAKLVRVLYGEIIDVAVDIRKNSQTYGKWVSAKLNSESKNMIYVPEGFAHGFGVLSETAEIEYCCSNVYSPEHESGIAYNDPDIAVEWDIMSPIVSAKDKNLPLLRNTILVF